MNFLKMTQYKYWSVFLHENQCYLGRVYLLSHDEGARDFLDIHSEEREEFFHIGKLLKEALTCLFQPDRFNYAMLSNVFPKLHVHLIPRYQTPRVFNQTLFVDKRWGKNYAPYDKEFSIPDQTRYTLQETLRSTLEDRASIATIKAS